MNGRGACQFVFMISMVVWLFSVTGCPPGNDDAQKVMVKALFDGGCRGCDSCNPSEGEGEPVEGEPPVEGEGEPTIVGAWAYGEDAEVVYNFCPDGTFTQWNVNYWGKCLPPDICKEKVGCGTYITGKDEICYTIDLLYLEGETCVILGRFAWNSEINLPLYLNVAQCGEPRPDLPYYYSLRSSTIHDCTCFDEGEPVEVEDEGEAKTTGTLF